MAAKETLETLSANIYLIRDEIKYIKAIDPIGRERNYIEDEITKFEEI